MFLIFSGTDGFAQISDGSSPASFLVKGAAIVPKFKLDSVHVARTLQADRKMGIPNRYGIVQQVDIDIRNKGIKTVSGNTQIWQYELDCPDAMSLGITFKSYYLPQGAKVFIYSPDRTMLRGGFTSFNNKSDNELTLAEFGGSSVIIEYDEPGDAAFSGELVVGAVSKAYLDLSSVALANVGINCPAGADWQYEKHAVCLMSFHDKTYAYYCTGSLMNNVRGDQVPYFLTANHCLSTQSLASTLVTYFNYEYSDCGTGSSSKLQSLSGSTIISTASYSDFSLLKLSESPPVTYKPYFAGWDARSSLNPTLGACIHHPSGEQKSIAIDHHSFTGNPYRIQWDNNVYSELNTHWEVFYDVGSDASGSSGGPLFDQDHRVIGQLHGGDDTSSLFGKFSLSWNYNTPSDKQLKAWLDPDNTNTLQLDGYSYDQIPEAHFVSSVTNACLNTPVTLTDESKYRPQNWQWTITPSTFEFVNGTSATSQSPRVIFLTEGTYTISLTVSNENGSNTLTQQNLILATSKLPVAFQDVSNEMTVCGYLLNDYKFTATGASNYQFSLSAPENFYSVQQADTFTIDLKDEVRQYGSFDTYVKVTGSHGDCSSSDSILLHVVMPPNDDVDQAIALKLGSNKNFYNDCGTAQANEPSPPTGGCAVENNWCPPASGTSVIDNSVWFTFEGPSNGKITIQTLGVETQIAVYDASSNAAILSGKSSNYTILAAGENSGSASYGTVIEDLVVEPGKSYWLQVDGVDGAHGDFSVNLLGNTIEVYPNPSNGIFHLTVSSFRDGNADLEVLSSTGEMVLEKTVPVSIDSNTLDLDLSAFRSGLYIFRVRINGVVMAKKLMLMK